MLLSGKTFCGSTLDESSQLKNHPHLGPILQTPGRMKILPLPATRRTCGRLGGSEQLAPRTEDRLENGRHEPKMTEGVSKRGSSGVPGNSLSLSLSLCLSHSVTHSLTPSLTHSLTHLLTHSLSLSIENKDLRQDLNPRTEVPNGAFEQDHEVQPTGESSLLIAGGHAGDMSFSSGVGGFCPFFDLSRTSHSISI